jgi:heavy metal translocating P-type ATPase
MAALRDPMVQCGFAFAMLVPRLPRLMHVASRRGLVALLVQGACAWALARRQGAGLGALRRALPDACVPLAALAALGLDIAFRGAGRARGVLWTVLTLGMAPAIAETAEAGWSAVLGGDTDVPALLAMQLGLLLGQLRASAVILLMLTGGEVFEERALQRAGDALHSLLEESPGEAHVAAAPGAAAADVAAEIVVPGDVLLVKAGEAVPVDGEALEVVGSPVDVDESLLTGETGKVRKVAGAALLGGSRNAGAPFWMRAQRRYADSVLALMRAKLREALESKAEVELSSKRFAAGFTPLTLAAAGMACLVAELRGRSPRNAWESVLAVLMAATPCPASIGVPIAMLSGISVASRACACTIKRGAALEALAAATVVVVDKTGTLTEGRPVVTALEPWQDLLPPTAPSLSELLASVEALATHPLAAAVCALHAHHAASQQQGQQEQQQPQALLPVANLALDERGVRGVVAGLHVRVGALEWCFDEGDALSNEVVAANSDELVQGASSMQAFYRVTSRDGRQLACGRLRFSDALRSSAAPAIRRLKLLGLPVLMLSGDRSGHLELVARELGIDDYESCLPHQKADRVQALRESGEVVLMIGDGGNDAAGLAAADVGLSVGVGKLASESASVVLMNGDLENVARVIEVSRAVLRVAKRTRDLGMAASMAQMAVAALGLCPPVASAVAQEFIDLGSVLHALSALRVAPHW